MRFIRLLALFGLLSSALFAVGQDHPTPTGFHWQKLQAIQASVLAPDGWAFLAEESRDTKAYFITQEKFTPPATFRVGYSLNCITEVSRKAKLRPSAYIEAFTKAADRKYSLIEPKTNQAGPFKMIWFGVLTPPKGVDATRMTYLLIANDVTDTAYVAIFEAPLAEWENAYRLGYQMMRNLSLDPLH